MNRSEELRTVDSFLSDPDNLHYQIHCVACREPLWETKILKRSGNHVISTETKRLDDVIPPFSNRLEICVLCGDKFYARGKSGGHLYLIKDMKSGIRRMI